MLKDWFRENWELKDLPAVDDYANRTAEICLQQPGWRSNAHKPDGPSATEVSILLQETRCSADSVLLLGVARDGQKSFWHKMSLFGLSVVDLEPGVCQHASLQFIRSCLYSYIQPLSCIASISLSIYLPVCLPVCFPRFLPSACVMHTDCPNT